MVGSDSPFLDHITYPRHLLSPDQSVYTVELSWLSSKRMTIQGQNNKYHMIKKDSRDKREDPTWYPQVPWLLKGTLISATANHHRPSKDGFQPVGHVRIKRVQGSMHMGSDLPFLDHIIYPIISYHQINLFIQWSCPGYHSIRMTIQRTEQ